MVIFVMALNSLHVTVLFAALRALEALRARVNGHVFGQRRIVGEHPSADFTL